MSTEQSVDGWFPIARRSELKVGDVVPMTLHGEEYVLYRRESGEPAMLEAFCPHLGAHLGYGGCVIGEDIRCPFHHWTWSPTGENVDIPYSDRPVKGRRLEPVALTEDGPFVLARQGAAAMARVADPIRTLLPNSGDTSGWPVKEWEEAEFDLRLPLVNLADGATVEFLFGVPVLETVAVDTDDESHLHLTHQCESGRISVQARGLGLIAISGDGVGVADHLIGLRPSKTGQVIVTATSPDGEETFDIVERHRELLKHMRYRDNGGGLDAPTEAYAKTVSWVDDWDPTLRNGA